MIKKLGSIAVVLVALAGSAHAQSVPRGINAYNAGDYSTALNNFQPLAERGRRDAQYNVGLMYELGKGLQQDFGQAAGWYQRSALQGTPEAQYALALMYQQGIGTSKDLISAYKWFALASTASYKASAANRALVARRMSNRDIETAQNLAQQCLATNYSSCN